MDYGEHIKTGCEVNPVLLSNSWI